MTEHVRVPGDWTACACEPHSLAGALAASIASIEFLEARQARVNRQKGSGGGALESVGATRGEGRCDGRDVHIPFHIGAAAGRTAELPCGAGLLPCKKLGREQWKIT